MAYNLISSEKSPFGRICRMLMIQNGIPFDFSILNFVDDAKAAAELSKQSPINRVPILVDDGFKIFDSRVIVNHLIKKHGLKPLTLEMENTVSVIYSCMDTSVTLFLMKRDGFNMDHPGFFLPRQRERIRANLEYLNPWAESQQSPRDWNYATMSLYSYLYWAQARGLLQVKDYPVMEAFLQRFAGAPGVAETSY